MSFLDKAKKAAKDAGTEAQKQAGIAKLSLELKGVRDDLKSELTSLGEQTLKLVREDRVKHESLDPRLAEINRLEQRAAEVEGKISDVKAGSAEH
ncbi:MAG: hypothetical protein WD602_10620 [Actinomycetota bacterium]